MPLSTVGVEESSSEKAVSPSAKSHEMSEAGAGAMATGLEPTASLKPPATISVDVTKAAADDSEKTPTLLENPSVSGATGAASVISTNENSEIMNRINAMLENTLNLSNISTPVPTPVAKLPFGNELANTAQGITSQPLDLSILAGINPELYYSIGQTLETFYPGSNSNTNAWQQQLLQQQRGYTSAAAAAAADSFIPGAISNRTLEYLTMESTMKPYRAIRGDTKKQQTYNPAPCSTSQHQQGASAGIIGDRGGYLNSGATGGGGVANISSPHQFGGNSLESLFKINRNGSPSDSETSGIGSDFSDTALIELMNSLTLNTQNQQQAAAAAAYNQYSANRQQQQQQQLLYAAAQAAAASSAAVSSQQTAAHLEMLKLLGIHTDTVQQQQQQQLLQQSRNSLVGYQRFENQQLKQLDFGSYASSSAAAVDAAAAARSWNALDGLLTSTSTDPYSIERAAKLYRNAATISEPTCTWSGQLPIRIHRSPAYSCKVFLGGVPWDITEAGLQSLFRAFGPLRIEWPGKDGKHPRYPSKGRELPVGYVYVHFENERSVKALLQACTHDFSNGGEYYYKISSRRMRSKEVQVIPWVLSDSNFVKQPSQRIDPQKTVFVGALHGMLTAEGLAHILNDLFGNVVYAGIDTDKHKYPIGSGRVTFSSTKSYMKAVAAAFVEIKTVKFTKKIQIDPYLEESTCQICQKEPGPYFCRDFACFRYFCRSCWQSCHSSEATRYHKPLMRNNRAPGFGNFVAASAGLGLISKVTSGSSSLVGGLGNAYQQVNPC